MARDILSEYGPDANKPQAARATSGGIKSARDVMNYSPPMGPIGITRTPGPGLGGVSLGNSGSQGKSSLRGDGSSGSPGIGGDDPTCGTNRG